MIQLPAPFNVKLNDDFSVEFEHSIENPEESVHAVVIVVLFDGEPVSSSANDVSWSEGRGKSSIEYTVKDAYLFYSLTQEVNVSVKVCFWGTSGYYSSEYSEPSNSMKYGGNVPVINAPVNVRLTEDCKVQFEYDIDNPEECVDDIRVGISYYHLESSEYFWGINDNRIVADWSQETIEVDLSDTIDNCCRQRCYSGEVIIQMQVRFLAKQGYANSEFSDWSNEISITKNYTKLIAPTQVVITEDYSIEFNYFLDDPYEAINVVYMQPIFVCEDGTVLGCPGDYILLDEIEWNGTTAKTISIRDRLVDFYNSTAATGIVDVSLSLFFNGKGNYSDSDNSVMSNSVKFNGKRNVDVINISPAEPVICIDHSYVLGKTIEPIDAYYENIEWSSDNDEIVTVDSYGKITGVGFGSANITATIGEVSTTVPVTVYEVISNVEDVDENAELVNAAGEIIDDIANSDNPDISNTDIDEEDLEEIRDGIREGISNDDDFYADIVTTQQDYDEYKDEWEQIQEATGDPSVQFEGAYNIEIDMYHSNDEGENVHIGNITELDNEISFTCDLPEELRELAAENEIFAVIRVHENADGTVEYEQMTYTINADGTFTVSSDKFSDFILCSLKNSGWVKSNGKWFYYDKNGTRATGWKNLGGWYYFDKYGVMQTGWKNISGKWYLFDANGKMLTGWQKSGGRWYYLSTSGEMLTGWLKSGGDWYYLSSSGEMLTGWQKLSGAWYYFKPGSGAMAKGWQSIGGTWYYFKSSGVMAANEYCASYWFNKDGAWTYKYRASWKLDDTGWWYGDDSGWYAKNESLIIDGKTYYFNGSGYCINP